jgi:hypothetical protein
MDIGDVWAQPRGEYRGTHRAHPHAASKLMKAPRLYSIVHFVAELHYPSLEFCASNTPGAFRCLWGRRCWGSGKPAELNIQSYAFHSNGSNGFVSQMLREHGGRGCMAVIRPRAPAFRISVTLRVLLLLARSGYATR